MSDTTFRLCRQVEGHKAIPYQEMQPAAAEQWLVGEIHAWLASPHGMLRLYLGNDLITFERCDDAALERAAYAPPPSYEDVVDEASALSFPASDPPAWPASVAEPVHQ